MRAFHIFSPSNNRCVIHCGFTLIELIVALVIVGLLGAFVFSSYTDVVAGYVASEQNYYKTQKAEFAILKIILELTNSKPSTIPTCSSNTLSYTNSSSTNSSFTLSDSNLTLNGSIIAQDVSSFSCSYDDTLRLLTISLGFTFTNAPNQTFTTAINIR